MGCLCYCWQQRCCGCEESWILTRIDYYSDNELQSDSLTSTSLLCDKIGAEMLRTESCVWKLFDHIECVIKMMVFLPLIHHDSFYVTDKSCFTKSGELWNGLLILEISNDKSKSGVWARRNYGGIKWKGRRNHALNSWSLASTECLHQLWISLFIK